MFSQAIEIKTKINKWDLIKLIRFAQPKETIKNKNNQMNKKKNMERQHMEWEEIFANNVTDKGLISKIYKQLIQLNNNKIPNPIKKQTFLLRKQANGQWAYENMLNITNYQRKGN